MANFPGLILTSAGRNLQAKAQIGQKLEFTRVGLGDGAEPSDPEGLTALVNVKQYLSIQSFEALGDGTSKIRAILTNQGLSTGFFVREIGVYAKDPDTLNEVLYSYSNSGAQSDFLPAEGGATLVEQIFDLVTVIGSAQNVTAVIDDYITIATKADVEEIRPYILPEAGLAGQLLRKANNEEGVTEWFDPSESLSVSVHSITERREAVAGQTVFNLRDTRTDGLAVYVNGLRLDPAQYTKLNPTQVELTTALAAGDVVQFVNNEETGLDELARVSLTGPTLVYEDSTNTYTVTDHDVFSTYGVSTDVGTASISGDTITLTIPMGATASAANLSVTRNGGTSTFQIAVNEQTVVQPELQQPADGATDVVFDPLLTASAFVVYPTGADTHASTDWQIATDSAFSTLVWQSLGDTANLESIQVPSGTLDPLTTYYIRVRYNASSIGASAWSATVAITTSAEYIEQPTITAPADGTADVATDPNITTGAFALMGDDTHASTDWQISDVSDFSNIVWQSMDDTANLESIAVPSGTLALETTYYVRARHTGISIGDSEWSPVNSFVTRAGVTPQEAFSTTLYNGNGTSQTISNGIDFANEGGMAWFKARGDGADHAILDTARGVGNFLIPNTSAPENYDAESVTSFNTDGFSIGSDANVNGTWGDGTFVAWSFRKTPRFFDVVTYTGDGVAGRQIAHDLGVEPGMIIIKCTNQSVSWGVYHKDIGSSYELRLNDTGGKYGPSSSYWNDTSPTAESFTVGTGMDTNYSGYEYVAYLFAQDATAEGIIQCGKYIGDGSASGPVINLGWEPQYIVVKRASGTGDWEVFDSGRGNTAGSYPTLWANINDAEIAYSSGVLLTQDGFTVNSSGTDLNANSHEYIYMAIRKPII